MAKTEQDEWADLWRGIRELSATFPEGLVFIGGVAVYLQVLAHKLDPKFIEFSHDGDFYVSLADFSDLRELEEVTQNRRLGKHQFIKYGIEFDVYVEHGSNLRVPYKDIAAGARVLDEVPAASLEHLLFLKLAAYEDRRQSAKGRKDERDLIRIMLMLASDGVVEKRVAPYLAENDLALLASIIRSPEFMILAAKNTKLARHLRDAFLKALDVLERATK